MADLFKVIIAFGVFIGISALCEWIADNAPFVIWILIPVTIWITYLAIFGKKERKIKK